MRKLIWRNATQLLGCSTDACEFVFGPGCMDDPRCRVLYNGFDVDLFRFDADGRAAVRKQYGLEESFVVGHVGRFEEQKNHRQLIEQFAAICARRPDAMLLCVGRGSLMDEIRAKSETLGISDRVIFAGAQKDTPAYYSAMDVFLFPSLYEGLGSVLIEAQANGLSVITTQTVVPQDIDVTGRAAFVPLEAPAETWAEAVLSAPARETDGAAPRRSKRCTIFRAWHRRSANCTRDNWEMPMHKQGLTIEYHQPLSAAGCMLCALYFVILAVLPLIPSQITRVLKPVFLIACVFSSCRRYPMPAAAKVQSVFLIYLFLVLMFHPLTPSAIETYISIFLFGAFFIFASMRVWNAREIRMLLDVVVCSGVIMSAVCIFSNDGLLHASGAQHIHYLNTEMNRNPIAFGIALCALTAAILMLHCPQRRRKHLPAVAFLLCSYSVFALGCRSAFLSYVGGMLVLLLDYICNSGNRRTRFARGVVILLLVVCAAAFALNISEGTYSERLFHMTDDSGRDAIWESARTLIREHPVFGGGYDVWNDVGPDMGTHNTFLLFSIYSGYVGGAILILLLAAAVLELPRRKNWIPLVFVCEPIFHVYTETNLDNYFYLPLVLGYILALYLRKNAGGLSGLYHYEGKVSESGTNIPDHSNL